VVNGNSSSTAASDADFVISVRGLTKTYATGFAALRGIDLGIRRGEIFALLGPSGAVKSTLINIICGIVNPGAGSVLVDGHDVVRDYRRARQAIGLVPQEIHTDMFERVRDTVAFSRGLFGRPPDPARIERVLRQVSLWDKRDARIMTLSGGMKRRVMLAKALAHEPRILFLDEPTAGVDVELRRGLWDLVRNLRADGVTIILTTHYIEEAEEMADRIGIIDHGEIRLVDDTAALLQKLGRRELRLHLHQPLATLPPALADLPLQLAGDGTELVYAFDAQAGGTGIAGLLAALQAEGIGFRDLATRESSLEEIFVGLLREGPRP